MKNQLGIIVLILISVGLIVALVVNQKKATELHSTDASTIGSLSNELKNTTSSLEDVRKVNTDLNKDLDARTTDLMGMTNHLNEVSGTLVKTAEVLKSTQEQMAREVAQRDAKITELEGQNHALDQRALDLTTAITNLTGQIEDTQKKLAASEGDKAFLQKELQRLMTEKAELEKQFNDLKVLRTQVAKLQEELTISRRLQWIRDGIFARDSKKGAQLLMEKSPPNTNTVASRTPKPGKYDLNVEVSSDGTVKVIPPLTNAPAATQPAP
jgi:predicted  nucleic acid-binding Zn-ribbon protein